MPREAEFATDTAGKVEALRSCISHEYLIPNAGMHDCIVDLDITNPLRRLEDIEICLQLFEQKRPKTLFSVVKAKKNPYFNQVQYMEDFTGKCIKQPIRELEEALRDEGLMFGEHSVIRRQDAPEVFDLNCSIYIYNAEWLRNENNNSVITDNSEIYIMSDLTYCDIDNQNDFDVAQFLFEKHILKEGYVQLKREERSCCGGHGPDWFGHRPCPTQAIGVYIND
jgi:CMP-N-acetylneuraminic acid synthetase